MDRRVPLLSRFGSAVILLTPSESHCWLKAASSGTRAPTVALASSFPVAERADFRARQNHQRAFQRGVRADFAVRADLHAAGDRREGVNHRVGFDLHLPPVDHPGGTEPAAQAWALRSPLPDSFSHAAETSANSQKYQ